MDKIKVKNTIVEIDGDEMTRVMWQMVKEKLLLPYLDMNLAYYDLQLKKRDETDDKITLEAAEAIKKYGVGVKCATITPNKDRVKEYHLKQEWQSPNGTIRAALDGTVFRAPILVKNILPAVRSWKKPIHIGRHAYGDVYKNCEYRVPEAGKAEMTFTNAAGKELWRGTIQDFKGPGIIQGIHNTDKSIVSFAKACFTYAYDQKLHLWLGAKDTISKTYDAQFRKIFEDEYRNNWQAKFESAGLDYFFTLIDDAVARIMKTAGGMLWACKNYDGDVMSDMLGSAYGSLAMMTSVLVSPQGYYEFEASHGTVQKHYYKYLKGEKTSSNSMALIFAWTGCLRKRGELDQTPEVVEFAKKLEEAALKTVEGGIMTGDLMVVATPDPKNKNVSTEEFIAEVANNLKNKLDLEDKKMAHKAIREADGKRMLARLFKDYSDGKYDISDKIVAVGPNTDLTKLSIQHKWLTTENLVVKPDQLIKRRGKNKLILVGANYDQVKEWIKEKSRCPIIIHGKFDANGKPVDNGTVGQLTHFIIEPMIPHKDSDECYLAIMSTKDGDTIMFYPEGGVNVGDVDAKATRLEVPIGTFPMSVEIEKKLLGKVNADRKECLSGFIEALFKFYADLNFTYLEINPIVVTKDSIIPLDLAAKLDSTAEFESGEKWGNIAFPAPFGRALTKEEAYIEELDSQTGASLKLTILNPEGRVWTMVAGGGASVIYADTITDLGYMHELANYGEYSGDPSEEFTYLYAKTILDVMTRKANPKGKLLLIGGGIANFTDVANTFKGIIKALKEFQNKLQENKVKIYVRRGGPNYREGLSQMRTLGEKLGVPIEVYGPETHMTTIVSMALKGGK